MERENLDAEEFEENPEDVKGMKICFDKNSPFSACPNIAKQWTNIFSLAFTARKFFLSIFEFPYTPYF